MDLRAEGGPGLSRTALLLAALAALAGPARSEGPNRDGIAFFESKVRPVLVEHCYACHSDRVARPKGGLRVDTREGLLDGGNSGPAVVPGSPGESLIVLAVEHAEDVAAMPPRKPKLPETAAADLRRWVEIGAPDPRTAGTPVAAPADPLDWWSLRPIARPEPPQVEGARTPIDAFVLARLEAAGLAPAPEADRRTLIRRLAFDLTGLPPTPAEIEAFLADESADAYERLVDRLLASPHHGERWARHWMDAVHFAETHGHDQDRVRPNAWPYRDYLIRAFNADTPYARFVQEQVAADALFPDRPELTVALGFLAAGPWDESSLRDIREDSIDRQVGHYLDRDDMVTTTLSTFASVTVHCARCHDHKFDPILQYDYYALQAVFAGVDKADRAYDLDPELARRRRALTAERAALKRREPADLARLLDPAIQADVAAWESALGAPPAWTILRPDTLEASGGSTLTPLPDHSVLAGGPRPDAETYTVGATVDLAGVTAIRLEVLPDDSLPSKGPGRNANGNLHLTEFRVLAAPASDPAATPRPIAVASASADFDQEGWGVAAAIDGNHQTAWGIHPRVGQPHQAVFQLAEDVGSEGGTRLRLELQQTYPAQHPIGRFRLAVTTAPRPVRVSTVPDPVAAVLAVPPASRTDEQRTELAAYAYAQVLDERIGALPKPERVFAAASEFEPDGSHKPAGKPRPVHVLGRGDIRNPGPEAAPGTIGCVAGLPSRFELPDPLDEGARRAALARWLTDPANPLTWRSIVNRVWLHHFGRGLVDTPNDFGRMGANPTHPELLDWLAADFRDSGGSLRRLHRAIVTSDAYRRSVSHDPRAAAVDADNRLLWRQNRRRLDADAVRDAILLASGRLDRTMGGPSVRHFDLRPGVHVTPTVDYQKYDWEGPGSGRRSVYRFLFRTLPDPFMDALDAADASQLTPARNESITPLQALALLHNRFVLTQAGHLARDLEARYAEPSDRLAEAFARVLGRPPSADEVRDWSAYAAEHGLANACRLLFNTNEFLFVN